MSGTTPTSVGPSLREVEGIETSKRAEREDIFARLSAAAKDLQPLRDAYEKFLAIAGPLEAKKVEVSSALEGEKSKLDVAHVDLVRKTALALVPLLMEKGISEDEAKKLATESAETLASKVDKLNSTAYAREEAAYAALNKGLKDAFSDLRKCLIDTVGGERFLIVAHQLDLIYQNLNAISNWKKNPSQPLRLKEDGICPVSIYQQEWVKDFCESIRAK